MNIYLLRHTKPAVNQGICYGNSDIGLLSSFPDEAAKVAVIINKHRFKSIYCSPLTRCRLLAEFLTKRKETIVFDKRLKEMDFGQWEGLSWSEIEITPHAAEWFQDYWNVSCPGGESFRRMFMRVNGFLNEIVTDSDENILIITHAGPIRILHAILSGLAIEQAFQLKIDYGEMLVLKDIGKNSICHNIL